MENHYYLGIDLDDDYAVISFFQLDMKEPETVSTVAGGEVFQIPLLLTKKQGIGQWFIGEEARKLAMIQKEEGTNRIFSRAIGQEVLFIEQEKYPAEELLILFLKKVILLAGSLQKPVVPDKVVFSLEKLSREATNLFARIAPRLGFTAEQVTLIDRKESFYYFAYAQKAELTLHDIALFDYRTGKICCCLLGKNVKTKPVLVTLTEDSRQMSESDKDMAFLQILKEQFQGHIISTVYLVGDGFEGKWMKQSLAFMCKGRRAFMGKNLYSKGACYAAAVSKGDMQWPYVYMGDNEMKVNLCLKVIHKGEIEFFTLINAGDNWYETTGECEAILAGTSEIDFWMQPPGSREAKIEKVTLADFPKRPDKVSRIRITAKPVSDVKVKIQIKDMGFGEFFKSSDKIWEYVMSV